MDPILFDSLFSEQLFAVPIQPVIIVDQPWADIGTDERMLLSKILAAVKLPLDSVTIKFQPSFDISSWLQKPKRLIYFGNLVKGIPQYEVIDANGVSIVASESLKDLLKSDASRKKLWQALKAQFSI
jgi:hypothetical protein